MVTAMASRLALMRSPEMSRVMPRRTSEGTTRLLRIIVDSAIDSTITMPVAAEIPPMNANRASPCWCWTMGNVSTK
jgi:hypothetical protein